MPTPYNLEIQDHCTTCTLRDARKICQLSPRALAAMDSVKSTSVYPKGSVLFVEGQEPRGVYILCSGRAKLTTSSSEGRTLIVRLSDPGEILGASSAILGCTSEVSVETLEPSQVNFIRRDDFLRLIAEHSDLSMYVAKQLSDKYRAAQRDIRALGLSQSSAEKLAKLILDWCDDAEKTHEGARLKMCLTHEEIGQMIGTTRETVTRLLGDFRRKHLIDVKGSTLFVPSVGQLHRLVTI